MGLAETKIVIRGLAEKKIVQLEAAEKKYNGIGDVGVSGVLGFNFACGRRPHAKLNRMTERTGRRWPLQRVLCVWMRD